MRNFVPDESVSSHVAPRGASRRGAEGRATVHPAPLCTGTDEPRLFGTSAVMRQVRTDLARLARLPWPVRIEGPTGSGKRIAAQLIHRLSARADRPFVRCSVHAVPAGLELSQLVGHARGAFTGAYDDRRGAVEAAHTGTLVLDEIGDASPTLQGILLDLVEQQTFTRLGDERVRRVDVRFVFLTNADLAALVCTGALREDLFYRLHRVGVRLPALTEHAEDIPLIACQVLERKARELGEPVRDFTPVELAALQQYPWPGNVRELELVVEEFVAFGRLPTAVWDSVDTGTRVADAVARHQGNQSAAARELGMSRQSLRRRLRRRGESV